MLSVGEGFTAALVAGRKDPRLLYMADNTGVLPVKLGGGA
jgi:hypothetical protein